MNSKRLMFFSLILLSALSLLSCTKKRNAEIILYPVPSSAVKSGEYSLEAGGRSVFVQKYKDICYSRFAFKGKINLRVIADSTVNIYDISPHSYGIKTSVSGYHIILSISQPRNLVVTVNHQEKLFIFAEAAESNTPHPGNESIINILNYNVDTTGGKLETVKLQHALNDISGSGKTLYFPSGTYLTGTLRIWSNSKVYFAPGALIQGSPYRADYPVDKGWTESDMKYRPQQWSNKGAKMTYSRLILIDSASNITLFGQGTIDGNGKRIREQGKPANLMRIRDSRNIKVEGLLLRDPAAWNTHILYSDSVIIKDVKIINDRDVKNTDGIDPDASMHLIIDGCIIYGSDDNIAIKSSGNSGLLGNDDDITVENCVFLTKKSAMKLGTETFTRYERNITFKNNDIVEADRAMSLYCYDGAKFENIKFISDRIENNYKDNQQRMFHFAVKHRNGVGHIKNVLIKNCSFEKYFPNYSEFNGLDMHHEISNVRFINLKIGGKLILNKADAHLKTNKFVKNVTFSSGVK